jgi:hypothetical protein
MAQKSRSSFEKSRPGSKNRSRSENRPNDGNPSNPVTLAVIAFDSAVAN